MFLDDAVACSYSAPCLFDLSQDPYEHNDLFAQPGSAAIIANIYNNYWNPLYNEYHPPLPVIQDLNAYCQSIIKNNGYLAPYTRDVRLPSLGYIPGYTSPPPSTVPTVVPSTITPTAPSAIPTVSVSTLEVSELYDVGTLEAYGYLLPLVVSDYLRLDFIANSTANKFIPIHNFANILVNAGSNLDTLYTPAWLDLTLGPQVVSIPDSKGRYYVLPIYDLWTEVLGVPGPRTTGDGAYTFVVTPPGWTGSLPAGLDEIKATTFYIYILGRVYTTATPADIALVNQFQDGFTINSLANYIAGIPPPVIPNFNPKIVNPFALSSIAKAVALTPQQLITRATELLKVHPTHPTDFSVLARLKRIGIVPGQSFNFAGLDPLLQTYFATSKARAFAKYTQSFPYIGARANGWSVLNQTMGNWGNFYSKRWPVAVYGYAANPVEDTIYPGSLYDNLGAPLDAQYSYSVTFSANAPPPVNGFWSVTLYTPTLVGIPNAYNRYRLSAVDNLLRNPDGSVTIYIQNALPTSAPQSNWLPVGITSGPIKLLMRLYWPQQSLFTGTWAPPPIIRGAPV